MAKKILVLVSILVCFLLVGCQAAEKTITSEKTTASEGPSVTVYEQDSVEEDEKAKPAEPDYPPMADELTELLAKSDSVKSFLCN